MVRRYLEDSLDDRIGTFNRIPMGMFLVVQWLRLHASTAGSVDLIPCQGSKSLHAVRCGQKENTTKHNTIPMDSNVGILESCQEDNNGCEETE